MIEVTQITSLCSCRTDYKIRRGSAFLNVGKPRITNENAAYPGAPIHEGSFLGVLTLPAVVFSTEHSFTVVAPKLEPF